MVNQVNCVNIGNVVWASLYRIGRDIETPHFSDGEIHEKTYDYCENLANECEALRWKGRYTEAEISRIREIAAEREILRDMKGGLL